METIKITQISRFTNDKQGNPLQTKDGRPYTRVNLKTDKYGDKWLSGFGNQTNADWKQGDEVEIIVKQNGEYLNFDTPKKEDNLLKEINSMAFAIHGLQADMRKVLGLLQGAKEEEEPPMPEVDEDSDGMGDQF